MGIPRVSEYSKPESVLPQLRMAGEFLSKHNIVLEDLKKILGKFKSQKICVIGDLIVDSFTSCVAVGMSREDPTIVVRPQVTENSLVELQ